MLGIRWGRFAVVAALVVALSFCLHRFVVGPLIPDFGMSILVAVVDGFLIGVTIGLLTAPWLSRD